MKTFIPLKKISVCGADSSGKTCFVMGLFISCTFSFKKRWTLTPITGHTDATKYLLSELTTFLTNGKMSRTTVGDLSGNLYNFWLTRRDCALSYEVELKDLSKRLMREGEADSQEQKDALTFHRSSDAIIWCVDPFEENADQLKKELASIKAGNCKLHQPTAFVLTKVDKMVRARHYPLIAKRLFNEACGREVIRTIQQTFAFYEFFCVTSFGFARDNAGRLISNVDEAEDEILLKNPRKVIPEGFEQLLNWVTSSMSKRK